VLEDTAIRHHHDGCINHSYDAVTPEVTVRRAWCAFIQQDAVSAQFFAWQLAIPTETVIEDSACDACDGGHQGPTLRSNNPLYPWGWTVRRTLFWSPLGALPSGFGSRVENSLFVGFLGSDLLASPLLAADMQRLVVRDVASHQRWAAVRLPPQRVPDADGAVVTGRRGWRRARIENNAWLNFDNIHWACLAGSPCAIASEQTTTTTDVEWVHNLFA
jgi:hypothetical protein